MYIDKRIIIFADIYIFGLIAKQIVNILFIFFLRLHIYIEEAEMYVLLFLDKREGVVKKISCVNHEIYY